MFGVMNSFDNESIVSRIIEKAAAFSRRSQFGQDIFVCERHLPEVIFSKHPMILMEKKRHYQVICSINVELFAQVAKHPRRIVFELEIVLDTRRKLVTSSIYPISITPEHRFLL